MRFFQLNMGCNGVLTKYAKDADGKRLKALNFQPGQTTAVLEKDLEAIKGSIDPNLLTEVPEQTTGFAYANPGDRPKPQPEKKGKEAPTETESETTPPADDETNTDPPKDPPKDPPGDPGKKGRVRRGGEGEGRGKRGK